MTRLFRRFRWLSRAYAMAFGYFWRPCPICGEMFGGQEFVVGHTLKHDGRGEAYCYRAECHAAANLRG